MHKTDIYNEIRHPDNKKIGDKLKRGDRAKIREILLSKKKDVSTDRIWRILRGTRPDRFGVIEIAEQLLEQNKAFE